nr:MAG: ORF1 [TTV-like mini virus]
MPWRTYYRRRRRRPWFRFWRPRTTVWRRRRRRYRRQPVRRRKLKSIVVKQFQPPCIHKCKIKGKIPLFWGTIERAAHNYELYELTPAPEKIPSGGLFSIKNFSLEALFAEQKSLRNIWTKSNNNLPLVRYTGARLKFWRAEHVDYITSYSTTLPMTANLDMYQSMHPGIHDLLQHKLNIARKKNNTYKKPYKIIHVRPPNPLKNKWYFQQDLANIPLLQVRTSAASFDESWVPFRSISSTISIFYLRPTAIQNANFINIPTSGYHARTHNGNPIYLYSTTDNSEIKNDTPLSKLVFLGNTNKYQEGNGLKYAQNPQILQQNNKDTWGNPFFTKYLKQNKRVYFSENTLAQILNKFTEATKTVQQAGLSHTFTETTLTDAIRYNPFRDTGSKNTIWLQSVKEETITWKPPESEIKTSRFLPLWVALFGFEDFQKKNHTVQNIDTENMIVIQTNFQNPAVVETLPIIDVQFMQGNSPYEQGVDTKDMNRWYPCLQYQQQTITAITLSGPNTPKPPTLNTVQATLSYCFYFKWGGNPPPMETITDPKDQPEIHLPTNFTKTTSLQNPTIYPQSLLYAFDERRGFLTNKAIRRLQTDWPTKEITFSDGSHFTAQIQKQESSSQEESTSEEEEATENLLLQLNKQRLKQRKLKLRIMQQMGIIPK